MQDTIKFINNIVFAGIKGNPIAQEPADDSNDKYAVFMEEFNHLDLDGDEGEDPMPPLPSRDPVATEFEPVTIVATNVNQCVTTVDSSLQNAMAGPSRT